MSLIFQIENCCSNLGIIGHSYGALYGGQLAQTIASTNPYGMTVYVSLSGPWSEWSPSSTRPLNTLSIPKLFIWGTGFSDFSAALQETYWDALPSPKHRLVFDDGEHWDYLPPSLTTCDDIEGLCNLVDELTADFTALFISKYISPEEAPLPRFVIDNNLVQPGVELTNEQKFFAGGHLSSFGTIGSHANCKATLTWITSDGSGTRTLP